MFNSVALKIILASLLFVESTFRGYVNMVPLHYEEHICKNLMRRNKAIDLPTLISRSWSSQRDCYNIMKKNASRVDVFISFAESTKDNEDKAKVSKPGDKIKSDVLSEVSDLTYKMTSNYNFQLLLTAVTKIKRSYNRRETTLQANGIINGARNMSLAQSHYRNDTNMLDPEGRNIQFIVFTRNHSPFNLKIGDVDGYKKSGFNASHPTKIIIHGFLSSIQQDVFVVIKDAYLDTGYFNVVGFDWSRFGEMEYSLAVRGMQEAGKVLGDFLNWIHEMGVDFKGVHVLGHSLGAHIPGIASLHINGNYIGRITGLDPAAPGLREVTDYRKLDVGDAKVVDIIHTNVKFLGMPQPMGHVDFYPNGGRLQPGCPDIYDIWKIPESVSCNHARAYYLFAETVRNKRGFKSNRCKSVDDALNQRCVEETDVYMGQVESYESGLYFLRTLGQQPFSLNTT